MTPDLGAAVALVVIPAAIIILAVIVYRMADTGRTRRL